MSTHLSTASESDAGFVGAPRLESGIYKLNEDILRSIFLINTDPDNEVNVTASALTTTRYSSQVCGYWRGLILQWPFLWGRLIDLHDLQQKTDFWRDEVLRRSGDSLLCVRANDVLNGFTEGGTKFIGLLLRSHWHRMQKIDVEIYTNSVVSIGEDPWYSMQQPAPYLDTFVVSFSGSITPCNLLSPDLILFSGQAPSIREFFSRGVVLNFPAPWLSNLRRFSLSSPVTDLNQFLNAIKDMTHVEYLSLRTGLGNILPGGPSPSLPHIILPRLKEMTVANDIGTCLALVECIAPPPGSMLSSLTIDSFQYDLTTNIWDQVFPSFSNYFQNYFNSCQAQQLSLNVSNVTLYFRCYNHLNDIDESTPYVKIDIWCPDGGLQPAVIPDVLSIFSAHNFSSVTSLRLIGTPSAFDPTNSQIIRFIASLSSLTILRAPVTMLQKLTDSPEDTPLAFPVLRTVHLEHPGDYVTTSSMTFSDVKSFLEWRIDKGQPIHEFRLVDDYWFTKSVEDEKTFEFLEKMSNLKVTLLFWPELREYICGEGPTEERGTGMQRCCRV